MEWRWHILCWDDISTGFSYFLGRLLHSRISRTYFAAFGCIPFIFQLLPEQRTRILTKTYYMALRCTRLFFFRAAQKPLRHGAFGVFVFWNTAGEERILPWAIHNATLYPQHFFIFPICNQSTSMTNFEPFLPSCQLAARHVVVWIETFGSTATVI
jgi:hypothetical protein